MHSCERSWIETISPSKYSNNGACVRLRKQPKWTYLEQVRFYRWYCTDKRSYLAIKIGLYRRPYNYLCDYKGLEP